MTFSRRPGARFNRGRIPNGTVAWDPSFATETFFWADATKDFASAAENDAAATWINRCNGRGLLAALTGTNCKVRNIRGRKAIWLDRSAPAKMAGLISPNQAQPVFVAIVATSDTASSNNVLLGGGPGGAATESRITLTTTSWPRTMTGGAGTALSAGAVIPNLNRPVVASYLYNGAANSKIYLNETLKNTGNGGTANFEGFTIGDARAGSLPFGGLVAEVVAMLNPSAALILQLQRYLENKYATNAKAWKWGRFGDSTVAGTGASAGTNGIGQAMAVWSNGAPNGAYIDFVGSVSAMSLYSNAHHFGVGGTDSYNLVASIGAQLTAYQPDIIDIVIGINDAAGTNVPYDGPTSQSNIASILATCRTTLPNSQVLYGPITQSQTGTNVADLNARILAAIAAEQALGGKVILRDDFTALNNGVWSTDYMSDSVHPKDAGYALIATEHQRAGGLAITALG